MEKEKIKLSKKRIVILVVLCLVVLLVLFGIIKLCKSAFSKEVVAGNIGINRGIAVSDGSQTYYNKDEKGIVKVKGGKAYQIVDETAYSMTVKGDTLYYLTVSSTNTIDLKSVKSNGDELTKITELLTTLGKFYMDDEFVYYAKNSSTSGIAKISLTTGEETIIAAAQVRDFVLDEDVVYFVDSVGALQSVNVNGKDNKEITTEFNLKYIQILGKWIYFYNDQEAALYKMKKDGSDVTKVATFINNEVYNVTSKGIYYFNAVDRQICVCDLKGKKSKPVVAVETTNPKINVVDGILYYFDNSSVEGQLFETKVVKSNGNAVNYSFK